MAKQKQIVKELKRPDQFVDFWTRTSQRIGAFVIPRRKPLLALLVAAVVAMAGAAILERWEGGKSQVASQELARIQRIAAADLLPAAHPDVKDETPRYKTDAERRDAVLRELESFLKSHGGTRLRVEALLMKGSQLLSGARYDEALAAYQQALDGKLDARLRFLAIEGQGYAHEGKGDLDKAMASFAALAPEAQASDAFYRDRALYHKARLTARKGDKAGAAKLYREVLSKVPETALHDEITDRLALLEGQ